MNKPKPAHYLCSSYGSCRYVEKTNPHSSTLQFLTYGVYELDGSAQTGLLAHPGEEALLFCWRGGCSASVNGRDYRLETYDVLYVPSGAAYRLSQAEGDSKVIVCRAPSGSAHPVFHAKWKEFSKDEKRI